MLAINSIKKQFKNTTALNDVSIEFPKRGIVFITGKSGCGKSTLLNILGGLERYDSGDITINGKSSKNFTEQEWDYYRNTYIGFVFQDFNLIEDITVFNNVKLALNLQGNSDEKSNKQTTKLLKQVELLDKKDNLASELSGGQKQRVAIARALVKNPDIILADEPTGNLDSKTSVAILDLLKELSKDRLVIMVSHDTEYTEKYADRVVRLKDGKVIEDYSNRKKHKTDEMVLDKSQEEVSCVLNINSLDIALQDRLKPYLRNEDSYLLASGNNDYISNYIDSGDLSSTRYKDNQVKNNSIEFKKSKLPFNFIVKMAFDNLKIKKLRLLSIFVMFTISLTMFGFTLLVASYDETKTYARAFDEVDTKQFAFSTKWIDGQVPDGDVLAYTDVEYLKDNNSDALFGYYYDTKIFPSGGGDNTVYSSVVDEVISALLESDYSGYEVIVDELDRLPINIIEGTKDSSEMDVIIIPDFIAYYIIHSDAYSLISEDAEFSDLINKEVSELIPMADSETSDFKIVGIYETNTDETLNNTEKNRENSSVIYEILMQYSIYVKTDYDPETTFDMYKSGIYIDGDDELIGYLRDNYKISANTVFTMIENFSSGSKVISQIIILFLVIFTIFTILLMYQFISIAIEHNKKEIGTLRALGVRTVDIFKIYFIESLLIMLFITITSIILILYILSIINGYTEYISGSSFNILVMSPVIITLISTFSIFICFISTFKPIRAITRLKPIEAIKY